MDSSGYEDTHNKEEYDGSSAYAAASASTAAAPELPSLLISFAIVGIQSNDMPRNLKPQMKPPEALIQEDDTPFNFFLKHRTWSIIKFAWNARDPGHFIKYPTLDINAYRYHFITETPFNIRRQLISTFFETHIKDFDARLITGDTILSEHDIKTIIKMLTALANDALVGGSNPFYFKGRGEIIKQRILDIINRYVSMCSYRRFLRFYVTNIEIIGIYYDRPYSLGLSDLKTVFKAIDSHPPIFAEAFRRRYMSPNELYELKQDMITAEADFVMNHNSQHMRYVIIAYDLRDDTAAVPLPVKYIGYTPMLPGKIIHGFSYKNNTFELQGKERPIEYFMHVILHGIIDIVSPNAMLGGEDLINFERYLDYLYGVCNEGPVLNPCLIPDTADQTKFDLSAIIRKKLRQNTPSVTLMRIGFFNFSIGQEFSDFNAFTGKEIEKIRKDVFLL